MKVHPLYILTEFMEKHPTTRSWIRSWLADVRAQDWENSHDVKNRYKTVSFLPGNWAIFNVKGNDFRLVVQIAYRTKIVSVKWVGLHSEYSKIDWEAKANETRGD